MSKCSVCQTELIGLYCHHCGQKVTGKRATFGGLIKDAFQELFSLEKSFFATLWKLLVAPRIVIESYWKGNRRHFLSPSKMLIISLFFIGIQVAFFDKSHVLGIEIEMGNLAELTHQLTSPQLVALSLLFPLLTCTFYVSFLKAKHSLAEQIVATGYLFATWAIVSTVVGMVAFVLFDLPKANSFILFISMIFWNNARVNTKSKNWIRLIGNFFLSLMVFIMILFLLGSIAWLIDPSTVDIGSE